MWTKYISLSSEDATKQLKVFVDYEKWGMNYFSWWTTRRGIYLYMRSVTVDSSRGYTTESFMMFGEKKDRKYLLKEVWRDNKKLTEKIATEVLSFPDSEVLEIYNNPNAENSFWKFISSNF